MKVLQLQKIVAPVISCKVENIQTDYKGLCIFLGVTELNLNVDEQGKLFARHKSMKKIVAGDLIIRKIDGDFFILSTSTPLDEAYKTLGVMEGDKFIEKTLQDNAKQAEPVAQIEESNEQAASVAESNEPVKAISKPIKK